MERLRLNYSNLSVNDFISKAQTIVNSMTGNPVFATPNPSLATIQTLIDNLDDANIEVELGNYTQLTARNDFHAVLGDSLAVLGNYVENIANGNRQILESSGFDLAKTPERSGILPAPIAMDAQLTGISGQVQLKWQPVKGAQSYIVEATTGNAADPNAQWVMLGVCTRARFVAGNLTPALFYSFRVCAVNWAGNSAPSEPATSVIG